MDFGSLLHAAQANEHRVKQEPTKCYRSKFSPPKKEGKSRTLSVNIKKFLQRKEEEEKQRELGAKKKRDELLALRSQDGKAKKRVSAMLKRTKAANKSAIEDAIDDDNTAVTINGPSQPDEDDYGYVSQEASAYYNKLMDKYNSTPAEEPLFSQSKKTVHRDLNSTKDRVRMALLKKEEEEMMPHKRKRKSKTKKEDDPGDTTLNYSSSDLRDFSSHAIDYIDQETEKAPPPKPKPKRPAPPPMDFRDLLKLAEKKQFEPIKIEPKRKPEEEEERPMTKKQKLEYMKELEWRRRKEEAKAGRELSAQSKSIQNSQKTKFQDEVQMKQNDMMERSQEKQVKNPQQVRIPKINSTKRDDQTINTKREESSCIKREEKYPQKHQRTNGNYSNDSSYSNSSKASIPMKDKQIEKSSTVSENMLKSRTDAAYNSVPRFSRGDSNIDRHKIPKNVSIQSSAKHLTSKSVDMKNVGESSMNVRKNALQSGYDKKLQEAIMSKMEETKRNSEMKKKIASTEGISSKTINKSLDIKNKPLNSREYEKNISTLKPPTKLSKTERPSDVVQKQLNVKQSQDISNSILLNKSKTMPSSKSMEFSSDVKTKTIPSASKQYGNSDRARQTSQSDVRERIPSSDTHFKSMPPRDRQLSIPSNKLKNPPNPRSENILPPGVKSRQLPPSDVKPRQAAPSDVKPRQAAPSDVKPRQAAPSDVKPRQFPPAVVKPRQLPPSDVKPRQLPPSEIKSRQFPSPDVRPRQFPPPDVRSKEFPPANVRRKQKPIVKRRIMDSDEEYDSEMDDFIDDCPLEEEDVSKHIREIFGYDKRKYSRIDDDDEDECMESNYASILKEEFISTKTGILEDLEDIRREKEMERRKQAMKKRKL